MIAYRLLADLVVFLHFGYVLFVVLGLAVIVGGLALRRAWARNFWFRVIHLAMIGVVVLEAWLGIACPLTTLEDYLRRAGGQDLVASGFIERWTHAVMFYRFPSWVFAALDTTFGLAVLATFLLAPPRRPRPRRP